MAWGDPARKVGPRQLRASSPGRAGQDGRSLGADGPQLPRVKTEQAEDRGGDLRRLHGRADRALRDSAAADDQRDVPVLRVEAAVLGDLLRAAGEDHAVLREADDGRDARVT